MDANVNYLLARKNGGLIELGDSQTHATKTNSHSHSESPPLSMSLSECPGEGDLEGEIATIIF